MVRALPAASPDRRPRLLHAAHADGGGRRVEPLPLVLVDPAIQALLDDLEVFTEDRRGVLDLDAEAFEFELLVAGSEPELEPAIGGHVGEADLAEQPVRMIERQHAYCRAEPDAGGTGGALGHQHQRRRAQAIIVEVVFREPGIVEAGHLGADGLLDRAVQHGLGRLAVIALLRQDEYAELHLMLPLRRPDGYRARLSRPLSTRSRFSCHRLDAGCDAKASGAKPSTDVKFGALRCVHTIWGNGN